MVLSFNRLFTRSGPQRPSGRVVLVEPSARHYEAWSLLREASRHHLAPFEPAWAEDELSRGAFRRRLRRYRIDRRRGGGAAYFVERAGDRALLGGVTLTNIRGGVTQSASVGYWIGLPFVRQGYASDALMGILRYAFEELGLHRVEAACMPRNRASVGVLERGGFRQEGLARRYLMINGVYEDHLLFARLKDDVVSGERASEDRAGAAIAHPLPDGQTLIAAATGPPATPAEGHAA